MARVPQTMAAEHPRWHGALHKMATEISTVWLALGLAAGLQRVVWTGSGPGLVAALDWCVFVNHVTM